MLNIKKYAKPCKWCYMRKILPENISPAAAVFLYFVIFVWWQNDEKRIVRQQQKFHHESNHHELSFHHIFGFIHHLRNFLLMLSLIRNDILYLQHSISIWNQQCRKTLGSSEVNFLSLFFLLDIRFRCE